LGWEHGAADIERLLKGGELQSVASDPAAGARLLADARRHLSSVRSIKDSDPNAAFALLYDAVRKACSALLEVQGLRATSRGGHIAIRDAVLAQFGDLSGGEALRPYDRLRRRRNDIEYPDSSTSADADEIDEGLQRATAIVEYAERLMEHLPPF
jgi:hypothetical protein